MTGAVVQENRLRKFASFFKGYMGVMPIVTATVAPLLTMMKAIPVFESQKTALATYSGLLGFLLLAWVFYVRGRLTAAMGSRPDQNIASLLAKPRVLDMIKIRRWLANLLPLLLILGSVYCYLGYLGHLDEAIEKARVSHAYNDIASRHDILEKWGQRESIFQQTTLQGYYLGIFLFAEMAFVVMALREYAQGVLNVPEAVILGGDARADEEQQKAIPRQMLNSF